MGKKKIHSIVLIQDLAKRNVTFCKRKKGIIKKAIEISKLCDKEVALYILDRKANKLVVYNSGVNFEINEIHKYANGPLSRNSAFEKYSDADYEALCELKLDTSQLAVDPIRRMFMKNNPTVL